MVSQSLKRFSYNIPIFIISSCLTIAAGILFNLCNTYNSHVLTQITAVEIVFALLSILLFLNVKEITTFVLVIKIICLFFISRATGADILALSFLFTAFCFEVFYSSSFWSAFMLFVCCTFVFAGTRIAHTAWDEIREPVSIAGFTVLLFSGFAGSIAGSIIDRAFNTAKQKEQQVLRLEETIHQLTKSNTAWQTYATYIEENSKEEERQRISREIHDIVGYSMTNLLMIVQAALYSDNQDKVTELLQKAQKHINESLQEVRLAMRKLRSATKRALHGSDLITYLAHNFETVTGIQINLDFISFPSKIGPKTEEVLYRLLQESFTNSFRHGKATVIEVSFWMIEKNLIVKIRDNGIKTTETPIIEGIGIQGMKERINELGGSVQFDAVQDGFTVLAKLNLDADGHL